LTVRGIQGTQHKPNQPTSRSCDDYSEVKDGIHIKRDRGPVRADRRSEARGTQEPGAAASQDHVRPGLDHGKLEEAPEVAGCAEAGRRTRLRRAIPGSYVPGRQLEDQGRGSEQAGERTPGAQHQH